MRNLRRRRTPQQPVTALDRAGTGMNTSPAVGRQPRRTPTRTIVTTGVALSILAAVMSVAATSPAQASGPSLPVGTWNQTVHLPQGDEQTMVSFHIDGTVTAIAPSGSIPCPSGTGTCTLGSPSIGLWRIAPNNRVEITIKEYVYDSTGRLVNFIIPHSFATLSSDGNSYTASDVTGIWTAQNQLLFTAAATADGTRLQFPSQY